MTEKKNQEESKQTVLIETDEKQKNKSFTAIGIVMFIFAIIGLIVTIIFAGQGAWNLLSRSGLKEKLKTTVYPLAIVDVPEFSSVDKLDPKTVIAAGIWEFIIDYEETGKYEKDEYGTLVVPEVDIEPYIREIFGSDVEIQHQMIPDTEFYIPYDETNKTYLIPQSPQMLPYAPEILSVSQDGKIYEVEVGYILPGPFWDLDRNKNGEYNKTMNYTLKKVDKDSFVVLSVEMPKNTENNTSMLPSQTESEDSQISSESGNSSEVVSGEENSEVSQPAD